MDLIQAIITEAGVYPSGAQNRQGERARYVACRFKLPAIVACIYGRDRRLLAGRKFQMEKIRTAAYRVIESLGNRSKFYLFFQIIHVALLAKKSSPSEEVRGRDCDIATARILRNVIKRLNS